VHGAEHREPPGLASDIEKQKSPAFCARPKTTWPRPGAGFPGSGRAGHHHPHLTFRWDLDDRPFLEGASWWSAAWTFEGPDQVGSSGRSPGGAGGGPAMSTIPGRKREPHAVDWGTTARIWARSGWATPPGARTGRLIRLFGAAAEERALAGGFAAGRWGPNAQESPRSHLENQAREDLTVLVANSSASTRITTSPGTAGFQQIKEKGPPTGRWTRHRQLLAADKRVRPGRQPQIRIRAPVSG